MRPSFFKLIGVLAAALMFVTGLTGGAAPVVEQRFPKSPNVIDVKQPPYSAKGDGVTDDTDALQRALNENVGRHRMLYFPRGTYIVSRTLTWPKQWKGRDNWGVTMLCGQHRDQSILRLKDGTFSDAAKPAAIMWCGPTSTAPTP
jgi:hypothetical protein